MAVMSRSSSAVRNLRTIFENKESVNTDERSRSGSGGRSRDGRRPLSKVRSSFITVETMEESKSDAIVEHQENTQPESTASLRRQSFSANTEESDELLLRKVVTHESEKRGRDQAVQETIPEAAIESTPGTPLLKSTVKTQPAASNVTLESQPPVHPDKPVSGAEEEVASMEPSNVTEESLISEPAPAKLVEDIPVVAPAPTAEVPEISAPSTPKALKQANGVKNGSSKQPVKAKEEPARDLTRKVSRTSLTAPTAASSARATMAEQAPLPARSKRESTRPVEVSSHLLAPTAASRARHEADAAKETVKSSRMSLASNSSRSAPRASLARQPQPESRPAPAPRESFLERMTRPTAASQSRAQEKFEPKIPAKKPARKITSSRSTPRTSMLEAYAEPEATQGATEEA